MENTGVLFEDDSPQWYLAVGDRWVGPLSASDVYQKIQTGVVTWAHFVWKPGQPEWKRLCDVKPFAQAVPAAPARDVRDSAKEAAKPVIRQVSRRGGTPPPNPSRGDSRPAPPKPPSRKWFLYYNQSQFGPFSSEEVERYLRIGKIHGRVHIWRDGMKNWDRLETVDRFTAALTESERAAPSKPPSGVEKGESPRTKGKATKPQATSAKSEEGRREQRAAPRRPLVAKIILAAEDSVIVGVCRDISVGGMQVLTDRVPGVTGSRVKLNVSPASSDEKMRIEPFVAEGSIVRILEDGRGFSFRFDRLPETARHAIESYISLAESG
jgi:hypothetical protein